MDPGEGTSKEPSTSPNKRQVFGPYVVKDWTEDEKKNLLQALKTYGSKNLEAVAKEVPTKTLKEIEDAIKYYRSSAMVLFGQKRGKKGRILKPMEQALDVSITYWINILSKYFSKDELESHIGKAIKIIAECEDIPKVELTNGIDFKNIYLTIAAAIEGEPLPVLNNISKLVIKKCIQNVLLESEKHLLLPNINSCLEMMKIPQDSVLPIRTDTSDVEQILLERLLAQRNVNPFGMSLEYLKL